MTIIGTPRTQQQLTGKLGVLETKIRSTTTHPTNVTKSAPGHRGNGEQTRT